MAACQDKRELDPAEVADTSAWMRDIADSAKLCSFSIVGTHDSGASQSGAYYSLGQNQTYRIANQLKLGVRFLDIRLVLKKGTLTVHHGVINMKTTFAEVVEDCREFLHNNPSECVLLCVKRESGDDIAEAVEAQIAQDGDLWYTQNDIPTLGEVRGKIVLFRRFETDRPIGVNLTDDFRDNCAFAIGGSAPCYVQDYYKLETNDNLPVKWEKILDAFAYANSAQDTYVINFTSAYTDKIFGLPEVKKTAEYIHAQYKALTAEWSKGNYGIVLFDYIDQDLARDLIATNFAD